MKGGIQGLKGSQVSLVLIWLVCASVLAFTWTKTTILTSFIPNQGFIFQADSERRVSASFSDERKEPEQLVYLPNKFIKVEPHLTREEAQYLSSSEGNKEDHGSLETKAAEVSRGQSKLEQAEPVKKNFAESLNIRELPRNMSADIDYKDCNYAKGKWIYDDSRPLYSGFGCKHWLSTMWACRLTQRTDFEYEKLRWQPKDCRMENFSRAKFLERMRGKTLAFVGDSLGRQQFQSLMCMVTGGEDKLQIVDVGSDYGLVKAQGATRPDGWAYRFTITNTTILYRWSASLCDLEPINASNPNTEFAMHLDRPPAFLQQFLHKFDVVILNTGHHWNRGKLNANKWIMYVGGVPNTNRRIADIGGAKNFTIHSIVRWMDSQLPLYPHLKVFLRSISPRHFFNGDWNTGGTCDNTTPLSGGKEIVKDESCDPVASSAVRGTRVKLLDITGPSELRDEGHISRYSIKASPGVQDCLHWCLPGVPDTWNEILFARL